jgi:hypothetical protein
MTEGCVVASSPAIAELSMPPLSERLTGTSETSRRCTARASVSRISSGETGRSPSGRS